MRKIKHLLIILLFGFQFLFAQNNIEVNPPFNIKTIAFKQNDSNVFPFFRLGESFQFVFDDLFGNEEDYYFTLTHCNYNWERSDLSINEYISGIDNQRIQDYENSFNTLQTYSHYRLSFPNKFCSIAKSGNYILNILNSEREIVFTKKFIVYEELTDIGMQTKRSRTMENILEKQNIEMIVKSQNILFQNPAQNLKVVLFQNGKFNNAIYNIKPQFTIGNDLVFKYNQETQFYAGNEYLYFDNKEIKIATNSVAKIDITGELYKSFLYTDIVRKNKGYTYFPDINGNFQNRNLLAQNHSVESDYAWMYFTLFAPEYGSKSNIFVTGMFNDNVCSEENKMEYNIEKGVYEKAILIKQGFNNYNYTILNDKGQIDEKNAIDGNFYQTENIYTAIIYYRANGERYDRIIGKGETNSVNITN